MGQDKKETAGRDVGFAHEPLKPIMKYPGGKARELKYILPFAP